MERESQSERDQEYYNKLADKLDELQREKNNGRGVQCVSDIISYLRMGDIRSAKAIAWHDHDKINDALGVYKDIKKVLIRELFDDEKEHPWSVLERLKKQAEK